MSKKIDRFCESLRQQLTEIETKLNHTKADLETVPQEAQHLIQLKKQSQILKLSRKEG